MTASGREMTGGDVTMSVAELEQMMRPSGALRALRALLLVGPVATTLLAGVVLGRMGLPADWTVLVLATWLTLVWSPLFCSVPAMLLQDARDEVLPHAPRLRRAFLLIPRLVSMDSPVRTEQLLALVGFAAGVCAVALW